jgi:hypothetical protein
VNSIRKGFIPQTLLCTDKEGNTVNNKKNVLQRWSEYYEKHFELQDRRDNGSGEDLTTHVQTIKWCRHRDGNKLVEKEKHLDMIKSWPN